MSDDDYKLTTFYNPEMSRYETRLEFDPGHTASERREFMDAVHKAKLYQLREMEQQLARNMNFGAAYNPSNYKEPPMENKDQNQRSIEQHNEALLVRDDIVTVDVTFDNLEASNFGAKPMQYTYVALRDFAETLSKGQAVLVESKGRPKMAWVLAVHKEAEIDPNLTVEYKWAFMALDLDVLEGLKAGQARLVDRIKEIDKAKTRKERREALGLQSEDLSVIIEHEPKTVLLDRTQDDPNDSQEA